MKRDPKELYKKALDGEMPNVVGIDIEFKPPKNPDMVVKNEGDDTPSVIAKRIYDKVYI